MNRFLKAKMVEHFGSQFGFARAAGEHESIVSKVIHGRRTLDPNDRKKWARILKVDDPEKIFGQNDQGAGPGE